MVNVKGSMDTCCTRTPHCLIHKLENDHEYLRRWLVWAIKIPVLSIYTQTPQLVTLNGRGIGSDRYWKLHHLENIIWPYWLILFCIDNWGGYNYADWVEVSVNTLYWEYSWFLVSSSLHFKQYWSSWDSLLIKNWKYREIKQGQWNSSNE